MANITDLDFRFIYPGHSGPSQPKKDYEMFATKKLTLAATALTLGLGLAQDSQAEMILTFTETGSDVVLNVTGSLDLTGLAENTHNINLGATDQFNTNGQLQIGAGGNVQQDKWNLTQISTPVTVAANITGAVDSWDAGNNAQAMRFQQNNGQIAVDDAFGTQVGDTLGLIVNITSQHTFAGKSLADFGLTAGTDVLWMQNQSQGISGTDGDIRLVAAVPEPSSLALLGLGGLALVRRRRA